MSEQELKENEVRSHEEFQNETQGLAEYMSDPAKDIPPRFRELLFGHANPIMGLTKLDDKPAKAQLYALKANVIFQKFCVEPLELDDPMFVDGLINTENYVKLLQYQSRYPNPKMILLLKQYLVREGYTQQGIATPVAEKKGFFSNPFR